MSTKKVLTKDERRESATKIGMQLARKLGAEGVSMAMIAAKQGVSAPLLFHIFGTKLALVTAIKKLAKKEGVTLGAPAAGKVKALPKLKVSLPPPVKPAAPAGRKPLTAAQKEAKRVKDAARRAPVTAPKSPAEKFKALPKPFEAAIAQL